jgi:hypothetical protein
MKEAVIAIIASAIVGAFTYFIEEHLFQQEQGTLHDTLVRVIESQRDMLERCDDRCDH